MKRSDLITAYLYSAPHAEQLMVLEVYLAGMPEEELIELIINTLIDQSKEFEK